MTIPGGTSKSLQHPTQRNMRELIGATRQRQHRQTDESITVRTTRDASYFAASDALRNPANIHDWFLGMLTDEKPDETAPNLTGAMYWVKEVRDTSTETSRLRFQTVRDMYANPTPLEAADFARWRERARWLPAANIAEMDIEDPDNDTHAVPLGTIVKVFALRFAAATLHYYFSHPPPAGLRFCVIRSPWYPPSRNLRTVDVHFVKPSNTALSGYEPDGFPQTVTCWPGTRQEDYWPFFWGAPAIKTETTVLPILNVDGIWHVQLLPKFATQKLKGLVRTTDCMPT